ncbi:M28 family peptidase [Sphingomonas sp. ABOLH]|uniref:M28 family peptidase n=1 Tax=Sphingomonas sp. ABOLH TaxID=1985881 RepID=UPI000F7F18D5|nr:M28 family peptidase [Sphingomonas sp. ABOLH]RSV32469.1 peptidase M28 [Sphingomonas sp. ABOLH]
MTLRPILGLAALLCSTPVLAQSITPQMLRDHVAVLASDTYEGREPGTAGGDRAEAYVLQAFADAGLKPGAPDGRWRQEVSLTSVRSVSSSGSVTRDGRTTSLPGVVATGKMPDTRIAGVGMVYAGGLDGAALAAGPVRDKVVVMTLGPGRSAKLEALARAGAAAAIFVAPATLKEAELREAFGHATVRDGSVEPMLVAYLSEAQAAALLGPQAATLTKVGAAKDFRAVALDGTVALSAVTVRNRYTTANIVGMIPGTATPNEAVLLSAHWDHIGICRPEGAPDRICNGAADNASGTAILIEVAKVLAKGPPSKRSIYFVATTAEEKGLIGADAYAAAVAETPLKIVANLNIDTAAIVPTGMPVAMVGRGNHPKIDAIVDATARAIGRKVDTDTEANIMVQRQDGWAFGKRGIPAVMATGSVSDMKRLFAYLEGPYHKPNDDLAHIDLSGAAEDADLHVALARALADPARYPAN